MGTLFMAVVEAMEGAVLNAVVAADPMTGNYGRDVAAGDRAVLLPGMAGPARGGR